MLKRILPNSGIAIVAVTAVMFLQSCTSTTMSTDDQVVSGEARAPLIPGAGTYSRPISTETATAQKFFDQGLRFAWGFYFPESIASHQEDVVVSFSIGLE